jgi:hypothetical protein
MDLLDVLAAEREISRVLHTYARGADRHDWDAVRSCFHPDATDDHLDYQGDIEGLVAWLQERHAALESSVHQLGNVLIDVLTPTRAVSEAYCLTAQRSRADAGGNDLFVFSRYVDRFERREDGPWLIAARTVSMSMSRVEAHGTSFEDDADAAASWSRGTFGPDDPVYALLGARWHSDTGRA